MSAWVPLRAYAEQVIDDAIAVETDRLARATMQYHRSYIADKIELVLLRQMVAAEPAQQVVAINAQRLNGRGRAFKVAAR